MTQNGKMLTLLNIGYEFVDVNYIILYFSVCLKNFIIKSKKKKESGERKQEHFPKDSQDVERAANRVILLQPGRKIRGNNEPCGSHDTTLLFPPSPHCMNLSWLPTALRVKSKRQNSLRGPTPTAPTCFPSITGASLTLSLAQTLWSPLRSSVLGFLSLPLAFAHVLVEHNSHLHQPRSTPAPCTCLIPIHFSIGRRET